MAWTLEYDAQARRQLRKLSPEIGSRILKNLEVIAALDDPLVRGHSLKGDYAGYWRFRVGDFRIIARIEDDRLVIIVVALGHRREIYRD